MALDYSTEESQKDLGAYILKLLLKKALLIIGSELQWPR